MANYEATKYDFSAANLTGIQGVNTGVIIPWGSSSPPSGFLECDGSAVSRSTYATLFSIVGTTYGSGDGSTTFNLPDLTDKIVQGRSPGTALGTTLGANTVALSGAVSGNLGNTTLTTPTIASHTHTHTGSPGGNQGVESPPLYRASASPIGNAGGGGAHTHPLSGNVSGDYNTLQPYLTVMYVIKT
jgi:microcystin-dependent protein